jgi:hypothetical protein
MCCTTRRIRDIRNRRDAAPQRGHGQDAHAKGTGLAPGGTLRGGGAVKTRRDFDPCSGPPTRASSKAS